ncbi:MAG: LacI family transcriptional regulator [Propionibacteriaceae bacterium]|jgi:DNA-binding LacI/PurR family transcriptional regulator|nr:LacI family transcriptional regulator [Propionibacteriaceae bacterium]
MSRSQSAVTMRDVAALAGVSLKTVSNVVNDYPYLKASTRFRVEAAIEKLGYRVNQTARNLRQGRTGLIKLVLPELRIPYFAELADSIVTEAASRGLTVLLEQHRYDRELELSLLRGHGSTQVDGVIFSPINIGPADATVLQVDFPLVLLGESIFDAPCDHVSMRNIEGAAAQVEHLLTLGRGAFAVIGLNDQPTVSSSTLRFKGVEQALTRAGIALDQRLIAGQSPWTRSFGAQAMAQLLETGLKLDAVICLNDTLALGALYELVRQGRRVPEDVALIGFDNIEETRYSHPTCSTIDPGGPAIAHLAVEMLAERIGLDEGFDLALGPREVLVDFELLARASTLGA